MVPGIAPVRRRVGVQGAGGMGGWMYRWGWIVWLPLGVACGPKARPAPAAMADGLPTDCVRASPFDPVQLSEGGVKQRRGAPKSLTDYARDPYTIEVCGVAAEHRVVGQLTCPDGTAPVSSERLGSNLGPSRCDNMVDTYRIDCGDQTFDVRLDMYMCGPNESFR